MEANDYPLQHSEAARLLRAGIELLHQDGVTLRQLGKAMNYKQAVILSHMALGRVPIPIDRAPELALHLKLDHNEFLLAVLRQRHPDIEWGRMFSASNASGCPGTNVAAELELIARSSLDSLPQRQLKVMREAAADPNADRRWLSVHELGAVELLRSMRPQLSSEGFSADDRNRITAALE